ncbi:hypothetical protein [Lyngbya sp. PCC 8106]|uniref:hypothetical protein n=1 Tax=Lyngbya sp. (strain PCC 8106) TaxID=313612 RepID=UPI0000EA8C70|nr:hypothetical protein [Lyngbya sp. PCC 8106]EAW36263.1 hypothetical protein L8106_23076 [Lyngbya sp. PCC 8106]
MVNLLKKSLRLVNVCVLAISLMVLCFPTVAMADAENFTQAVEKSVMVHDGVLHVNKQGSVKQTEIIRSAIVSLPEGETGTVTSIIITGPDGQREFGCQNLKVQKGTDLIKECGGSAVLQEGLTIYQAEGRDFSPNPNAPFSVDLIF